MTSVSTERAVKRDRFKFVADHGTAMIVLSGGLLWLLPAALAGTQHGELISWFSLGIAIAGGMILGWRKLGGWRVLAAVVALAALGAMLIVLLIEAAGVIGAASQPDLSQGTYREAGGDGACSSSSCGGHEAGWRWAEERGITDPDECGGRSQSFVDGCRAYAEEALGES